jgi:UDP-glucose 4-epimerase
VSKCLVTGGCGFIGSHIVEELVSRGDEVIVIDDLSAPENKEFYYFENVAYHKLDISEDEISYLFQDVDYVFHCAARSRIQPTIGSPGECFKVNVCGTQRVLDASRSAGVKKLIYSGTSSLYGRNKPPFTTDMDVDCLNPYSMSKWMGEKVCSLYNDLYGFSSIVLRYFNVYGPREPLKGQYAPVIGLFKRQSALEESMTIVGSGNQRRDFTYISDVVAANISAMNSSVKSGIYNIGTGKNYSINQIAKMIGGDFIHIERRPAEIEETLASIEKACLELKWKPKFSLPDIINEY